MKYLKFQLTIFILFLYINNSFTLKTQKSLIKESKEDSSLLKRRKDNKESSEKNKKEDKEKTTSTDTKGVNEDKDNKESILSIDFYFQKIYAGNDPSQLISLSDKSYNKHTVSLYENLILLKNINSNKSLGSIDSVDSIKLISIYNKDLDDNSSSKCCYNIQKISYQQCFGDCYKSNITGFQANHCIELSTTNDIFSWRLCSENESDIDVFIYKLKLAILNVINKQESSDKSKLNYQQFIENSLINNYSSISNDSKDFKNWDWHNQLNWGSRCMNTENNLQSPIILDNPEDQVALLLENNSTSNSRANTNTNTNDNVKIEYYFEPTEPVVSTFGRENIISFPNYSGMIRLTTLNSNGNSNSKNVLNTQNNTIAYQPNFLSFKFPSEHQISGKRFDGELQLHLTEINPDKKSWLTNGLVISIFIESVSETKSVSTLETLKPDFWRLELREKKNVFYKPTKEFNLQEIFDLVFQKEPKFYIYKGSLTTPPCTNNVLRIVLNKSILLPELQFSVFRNQSLVDLRELEIHARVIQRSLKRKIISGNCSNVFYNKNLKNYIDNGLSSDDINSDRLIQNTLNGENSYGPVSRNSLRDVGIKFRK